MGTSVGPVRGSRGRLRDGDVLGQHHPDAEGGGERGGLAEVAATQPQLAGRAELVDDLRGLGELGGVVVRVQHGGGDEHREAGQSGAGGLLGGGLAGRGQRQGLTGFDLALAQARAADGRADVGVGDPC